MISGVAAKNEDKAAEVPLGHASDQANRPVQAQVTNGAGFGDFISRRYYPNQPWGHSTYVSTRALQPLFESETNVFKSGPVDQFQHLTHQTIGSTLFSRKHAEARPMQDGEGQVHGLVSAIKPSSETSTLQGSQPKMFLGESSQSRKKEVTEIRFDDITPLGDIITKRALSIMQHTNLRAREPVTPGQARTIKVEATAGNMIQPFYLAPIELFAPEARRLRNRAAEEPSSIPQNARKLLEAGATPLLRTTDSRGGSRSAHENMLDASSVGPLLDRTKMLPKCLSIGICAKPPACNCITIRRPEQARAGGALTVQVTSLWSVAQSNEYKMEEEEWREEGERT